MERLSHCHRPTHKENSEFTESWLILCNVNQAFGRVPVRNTAAKYDIKHRCYKRKTTTKKNIGARAMLAWLWQTSLLS